MVADHQGGRDQGAVNLHRLLAVTDMRRLALAWGKTTSNLCPDKNRLGGHRENFASQSSETSASGDTLW
jgi:hypothetical protein